MLNEIIKGVSIALNATFGDGFRIYQDDVRQGLKTPCFLIAILQPERSPLPSGRARQENPLDLHYIPADSGDNAGMISVAERLMDALELVTLPDGARIRGTRRRYEIVDGVLHFFVNYDLLLAKQEAFPSMESMELSTGTRKG